MKELNYWILGLGVTILVWGVYALAKGYYFGAIDLGLAGYFLFQYFENKNNV